VGRPERHRGRVTVAGDVEPTDPPESTGARLVEETAIKTSDADDDGTTSATALVAVFRQARADRRGVTLAVLTGVVIGTGCHLLRPVVASTVGGITSAAPALVGWVLRPLYPILPLLACAHPADRPDGQS
jgi:hypothetical protein